MPSIVGATGLHADRHATGGTDPITPASIEAVPTDRFPTGTGSPEGVLTAPVGTVYTDTSATFGAVEWIKAAGTGSTGWVVSHGDTGDVDVTAQCTVAGAAPIAGDKVTVRRTTTAGLVLSLEIAARSPMPSPLVVTLPAWMTPGPTRSLASVGNGTPSLTAYAGGVLPEVRIYSATSGAGVTFVATIAPATRTYDTPWRTS